MKISVKKIKNQLALRKKSAILKLKGLETLKHKAAVVPTIGTTPSIIFAGALYSFTLNLQGSRKTGMALCMFPTLQVLFYYLEMIEKTLLTMLNNTKKGATK